MEENQNDKQIIKHKRKREGKSKNIKINESSNENKNKIKSKKMKKNKVKLNKIIRAEKYSNQKILKSLNKKYIPLQSPPSSMDLFERKEKAKFYFEENKYNVEDILIYDNTNKDIQKCYLINAVKELNNEKEKINQDIIKEKIQKCGIILSKEEYENEINKVKDINIKNGLEYIDYRLSLIATLELIKQKKSIREAKKKLNIKKLFFFNHEAEIGNNNYFFYYLSIQFDLKLEEIYLYYYKYDYIVDKSINYLKNFLNLPDMYLFNFIMHYLIDKDSIKSKQDKENIINYIEGKRINKEDLIKAIKERNLKELQNEKDSLTKNYVNFKVNFDEKNELIKLTIEENLKIDRKLYKATNDLLYHYEIFNNKIIDVISKSDINTFEKDMFKNILPSNEYSEIFYAKIKPTFHKIIKEILNSESTIEFFNNTYKKKYETDYKKIEYHFNKENVQNEILKRISFFPIFDEEINAFTNPLNLSIVLNSIPGKYRADDINYFNMKILNLGRIIRSTIHEVLGHYTRRYYSFLTDRDIRMNTEEDDLINTKPEGGFHVEKNFLGFEIPSSILYLKEAIYFFCFKYFKDYPVFKKYKINEQILKNIIKDFPEIFDFISIDEKIIEGKSKLKNEQEEEMLNQDEEELEEQDEEELEEQDEEELEEQDEEDVEDQDEEDVEDQDEEDEECEVKDTGKKEENSKNVWKKVDEETDGEKNLEVKKGEENGKKDKYGKIFITQFLSLLYPVKPHFPAIISCGIKVNEIYIIS